LPAKAGTPYTVLPVRLWDMRESSETPLPADVSAPEDGRTPLLSCLGLVKISLASPCHFFQ
jgi:hypothetical protein